MDPLPPISVVSLGTTVLDDIHPFKGDPILSVPGGSGLFATLGARLSTPIADSDSVGYLVLAGDDFPSDVEDRIRDWKVDVHMARRDEGIKVARGRLRYLDERGDALDFEYISPPLRASVADIVGTRLLRAQAFHLFGPPEVITSLVPELLAAREREGISSRPLLVWEPAPATCKAENLDAHVAAAKLVDVFSPNKKEIEALGGISATETNDSMGGPTTMMFASKLIEDGIGPEGNGLVVVRCGEWGVSVLRWGAMTAFYPAYYNSKWNPVEKRGPGEVSDDGVRLEDGKKVLVNSTGAGNAFLGGFIVGWLAVGEEDSVGDRVQEACVRGSVSASFAVEQIGMPIRSVHGGEELWNGESAEVRITKFREWNKRCDTHVF